MKVGTAPGLDIVVRRWSLSRLPAHHWCFWSTAAVPPRVCSGDLDREPHGVEHRADLRAHEDEADDADHRDESQDQCIFGEALPTIVSADGWDECKELGHVSFRASFLQDSSTVAEGAPGRERPPAPIRVPAVRIA